MADKTWKAFERQVAKAFGCVRNSLSGGNSKATRSDTLHEKLFIECKYGEKIPGWELYQTTKELAIAEKKTPVLALKKRGSETFLVVCDVKDILEVANAQISKDAVDLQARRKGANDLR